MNKLKNVRVKDNICYFDIHSKHRIFTVLIDEEDFERVSKHSWSMSYSDKKKTYIKIECRVRPQLFRLHRFILNAQKNTTIDHINRNTLDNRKSNLRFCNQSQNMRNCKSKGNKTGYRGVYKNNINGKFKACISVNNKTFHIPGNFDNAESAALIRDQYALKFSNEFAILNFKPKERKV